MSSLRTRRLRQCQHPKLSRSPTTFALWWFGLLLLHGINVVYYTGVAVLYQSYRVSYVEFQLQTYSIGISSRDYAAISRIHACVASIHALYMLFMIIGSLLARQLVFQPDLKHLCRRLVPIDALLRRWEQSPDPNATDASTRHDWFTYRFTHSVSRIVFVRDGLFGVESVYFDHLLLLRELIEMALQSNQLYRMTLVLPRLWFIRFYVTLLVINCWALPFLHWIYRHDVTTSRLLCLMCDAILDMTSSIGVSLVLFVTYLPQYVNPHGWGFPILTWFDDQWFSNMEQEFQVMLIASWSDMTVRLIFALSLLQCIRAIKGMLWPSLQQL